MPGFRRSPGADHIVHAVELPELEQRRARRVQRDAERAPAAEVRASGPGGRSVFLQRSLSRAVLRQVQVPRPPPAALTPQPPPAALREVEVPRPEAQPARPAVAPAASEPQDDRRIELLERRLAKLAKLLEERTEQMQVRLGRAQGEPGVASIYSEVQGLQGHSEEVQRKRAMMSAIYEANRKLRERVGSERRDAE